jgi:glutaredoxin
MSATILYTRDGCAWCARLRASLTAAGERFTEVNLSREPQATTELLKLTAGRRVVPVLVRAGRIEVAPEGGTEF